MIQIIKRTKVAKNQLDQFTKLAKELVRESQLEPGCMAYELFVDTQHPEEFTFLETWMDEESMNHHRITRHVMSIIPKLKECLIKEEEIVCQLV
ncbi:MAG: putative quinol monooxygenase [Erysipelotrichaceae bacterium]